MLTIESAPLLERVRTATELLELMGADWRLLDELPAADRRRLHRAIAGLSAPDRRARRKRTKAAKAEHVRRQEGILNRTGIRALRRRHGRLCRLRERRGGDEHHER